MKNFSIMFVRENGVCGYVCVSSKYMGGAVRKFMQEYDFKEIKKIRQI